MKTINRTIELLVVMLITCATICFAQNNVWVTIDSLYEARLNPGIVVLPNGDVLVGGGNGGSKL